MNCVPIAPQPKQRGGRLDELPHGKLPAVAADDGARERTVTFRFAASLGDVGE